MEKDIKSYTKKELEAELAAIGEKTFRAKQIYSWLHEKQAKSFEEMTNLPKGLREKLAKEYQILTLQPIKQLESKLDGTKKYLFELYDKNII